tara:strand:+ start:239 stop:1984 length:1746 start_codon:yes stop_codon:yes gene_type:complete
LKKNIKIKKNLFSDILIIVGRKRFLVLQLILFLSSLIEVIGIVSIIPYLDIASDQSKIYSNQLYLMIYNFYGKPDFVIFLLYLGISIFFFFVITTILYLTINYFIYLQGQKIGTDTSNKILNYLVSSNRLVEFKIDTPTLVRNITQDTMRFSAITFNFLHLNAKILTILLFLGILFSTNFETTLAVIIFFSSTYFIIYRFVNKKIKDNGRDITVSQKNRIEIVTNIVYGIREFIIFDTKKYFLDIFKKKSDTFSKATGQNFSLINLPRHVVELFLFVIILLLVFYFLVFKSLEIKNYISLVGLYAVISLKTLPAFQHIYANITGIKSNYNGFLQIKKLTKNLNYLNQKNFLRKKIKIKQSIFLNNISYSYSKSIVLKDLNFRLNLGEKIAIVGKTGSGKTTLLNIILGLLKPVSGSYFVDNKKINNIEEEIYFNFSFVPQNIFLVHGSVKQNIKFSNINNKTNNKLLKKSVEISHLNKFINTNKKGINRDVGERGLFLSGGQLQRVGIARGIYANRDILILDESTSSLDNYTEKKIVDNLFKLYRNKTIIFITHKIGLLKRFDKVFLLKNKKLIKIKKNSL